ncbi:hypothetical protein J4467_02625 [Candidatus Woesearchaeota archaeon]|nr:hypothetical protein [Candidatus Woesearchaeota archaeon]
MPSRTKNTIIESSHRHWLKRVLGMRTNGQVGIDVFDREWGIELKCKLLGPGKYQTAISVADYQVREFPRDSFDRTLLWAFLYYKFSHPLEKLGDRKNYTHYVTERNIYFQPWNFIDQFPTSKGKLETWRYVRRRTVLEQEYEPIEVKGGTLHIPRDCSLIKKFKPELFTEPDDIPF